MSWLQILLASVVVLLVLWLVYAKWGYAMYYYKHSFPGDFGMTKVSPQIVLDSPTQQQLGVLQRLKADYCLRYELLKEANARSKKIATARNRVYVFSNGMLKTFYKQDSYFTKQYAECIARDSAKLADVIAKYSATTNANVEQLTVFVPSVAASIKQTYKLDSSLSVFTQSPALGCGSLVYLPSASDKIVTDNGDNVMRVYASLTINDKVIF